MAEPLRRFAVFLASPGDLAEERRLAREAVESINQIGRHRWHVDLFLWEDRPPAAGRPQEIINKDVDICDLFVGLLWERWGQPTGKYSSGFEEEFERARARRRETGQPETWLTFKKVDPSRLRDPGEDLKHRRCRLANEYLLHFASRFSYVQSRVALPEEHTSE